MRKIYTTPAGELILCVSIFSGMDLFMLGMMRAGMLPAYQCERNFNIALMSRANFKHPDGTPVMEPFVVITKEEYDVLKAGKDTAETVGIFEGEYVRTKGIEEISGQEIRAALEARYGKRIRIILIGGPPCPLYTNLSLRGRKGMAQHDASEKNSRELIYEYLRILYELQADAAFMEEVPQLKSSKYNIIFDEFIRRAKTLPYRIAQRELCGTHYHGNQARTREIIGFVHNNYDCMPVFPEPDTVNVKRVRDFLPIDKFLSGHFVDGWKTKNHFMCTVTSGSPKLFKKDGRIYPPSIDDLLLCFDVVKGRYIIPDGIPMQWQRKAVGNAVCESVSYALGKALIEKVFKLRHIGKGYFVPIDAPDGDGGATVETTPVGDNDGQVHEATSETGNPVSPATATDTGTVSGNTEPVTDTPVDIMLPVVKPVIPPAATKDEPPVKWYESGREIWRGKSLINGDNIVAILTLRSDNRKTGDMCQLYILHADVDPVQAIRLRKDDAVCGNCHLRQNMGGPCYVYIAQDPLNVWKAWYNGAYPKLAPENFYKLKGLPVRFGAYGDPGALPVHILNELKKHIGNHTGYTHRWKNESVQALQPLCMASVETPEQQQEASAMGWRTFRIIRSGDALLPDEVLCPHTTHGVQCVNCQLCKGTSLRAKNIAVHVHGAHKNKFNPVVVTTPVNTVAEGGALPPLRNVRINHSDSKAAGTPKIINSLALIRMEFQVLDFEGRWQEFLGLPAVNFHCVIHGLAGGGKSTLAIQLASYLADNFGKAVYITAEEGFVKSFKDKFLLTGAASPSLDVADLRTAEEIIREVPVNAYNFIFIDSLDTMKIGAAKLKEIKRRYANSALVTISQSTKGGEVRGSYELIHDCDVTVMVTDGVAETTKNRFKEKGTAYAVFQDSGSKN